MSIDEKFGIVILLDALGTRTTDLEFTNKYLSELNVLKQKLQSIKEAVSVVVAKKPTVTSADEVVKNFHFRFFGDSVLMTYSFPKDSIDSYFKERIPAIFYIVCKFMCFALNAGIPFRGAISIGSYLSNPERDVDLGPAISDAANWYDKSDLIGVMVTPYGMNFLNALYKLKSDSPAKKVESPIGGVIRYNVPISTRYAREGNKSLTTYLLNWPLAIQSSSGPDSSDWLLWFYNIVKSMQIPPGTESKYSNTEAFIKRSIEIYPPKS